MSTTDTLYTFREVGTELIERGRDQIIRAHPERDGATVTPTPGTVSVFDASGTAVVDAQAFSVTADVAHYTISAATTASLELEEGWRIEWTIDMPDSTTRVHREDAQLVRTRLYPPVGHTDLYRVLRSLDPSGSNPLTARSDYQDELDEAWREIEGRLVERGRRPWLAMSPSSFRRCTLALWVSKILDNEATRIAHFADLADRWRGRFSDAWGDLSFQYDADDDGEADGGATPDREGAQAGGGIWLQSR